MGVRIDIVVIAGSLALCFLLSNCQKVESIEVRDEYKVKAIKDHVEEIRHLVSKRDAEEKPTTTSTKKPAVVTTTAAPGSTKKPRKHGSKKATTSKPDSDEEKDESKVTKSPVKNKSTTAKPSSDSTKSPSDLVKETEDEADRERDYWKKQEKLALSYSIAGLDSWIRAYTKLGRSYDLEKLGELLYTVENRLKRVISPSRVRRLVEVYRNHRLQKAIKFPRKPQVGGEDGEFLQRGSGYGFFHRRLGDAFN